MSRVFLLIFRTVFEEWGRKDQAERTVSQALKATDFHGMWSSVQASSRLGFSGEVSVEELEQK